MEGNQGTEMIGSFNWLVDGKPVYFDQTSQQQFIDCPRGCNSGRAVFIMREEDADAIGEDAVSFEATFIEEDAKEGDEPQVFTWQGYYLCSRLKELESGNVVVEFRDKRVLLERGTVNTEYNTINLVAYEPGGSTTTYNFYVDEFCRASNTPHTFVQIVEAIFDETELEYPGCPSVAVSPITNISGRGNCATILQGLLASVGLDMIFDPFAGTVSIVRLTDTHDVSAREEATADGRIVYPGQFNDDDATKQHIGKAKILPSDYFPVQFVEEDEATFGDGGSSINIRDYQLADDITRTVKTARLTEIEQALDAWYQYQDETFTEYLWGIVEQVPGARIYHTTWMLKHEENGTHTKLRNYVPPIPWAARTEFRRKGVRRGKTREVVDGSLKLVEYYKQSNTGSYTATNKDIKAVTIGTNIAIDKTVAFWEGERTYLALEVC